MIDLYSYNSIIFVSLDLGLKINVNDAYFDGYIVKAVRAC